MSWPCLGIWSCLGADKVQEKPQVHPCRASSLCLVQGRLCLIAQVDTVGPISAMIYSLHPRCVERANPTTLHTTDGQHDLVAASCRSRREVANPLSRCCPQVATPCRRRIVWTQEDMKTFLRKEFSGLFSVRNIFSEELARSELEAMKRDASICGVLSLSAIQSRSPYYEFPCANGTLRLPGRPRPSSTAERNLEREDDVEIGEGDKKGSSNRRDLWSRSGVFISRQQ